MSLVRSADVVLKSLVVIVMLVMIPLGEIDSRVAEAATIKINLNRSDYVMPSKAHHHLGKCSLFNYNEPECLFGQVSLIDFSFRARQLASWA